MSSSLNIEGHAPKILSAKELFQNISAHWKSTEGTRLELDTIIQNQWMLLKQNSFQPSKEENRTSLENWLVKEEVKIASLLYYAHLDEPDNPHIPHIGKDDFFDELYKVAEENKNPLLFDLVQNVYCKMVIEQNIEEDKQNKNEAIRLACKNRLAELEKEIYKYEKFLSCDKLKTNDKELQIEGSIDKAALQISKMKELKNCPSADSDEDTEVAKLIFDTLDQDIKDLEKDLKEINSAARKRKDLINEHKDLTNEYTRTKTMALFQRKERAIPWFEFPSKFSDRLGQERTILSWKCLSSSEEIKETPPESIASSI